MKLEDVTAMLPKSQIPKKGLTDEAAGAAVIEYAKRLSEKISQASSRFEKESDQWEELERLKNSFLAFRWAYPIKLKPIIAEKCDRTKGLIGGPLFTSSEFPWPEKNGFYREPIVQFFLDDVGSLIGNNLGEGLLQLWVGPDYDDYLIRVIPNPAIIKSELTVPPYEIRDEYFENSPFSAGFESWPESDCKVYQIAGVKNKVLSWDSLINFAAEGDSFVRSHGENLAEELRAFVAIIPDDLPNTEPHFFGNFSLIQYDVSMRPRTLLALEGRPCFLWGDCGNAQIFYDCKENENTEFSFSWGCT